MKRTVVALLSLLVIYCADSTAGKRSRASEQRNFSAENIGVQTPVSIPSDVMAILSKDETVQTALSDENLRPENLSSSWFSASEVHLTSSAQGDLMVMGSGPLRGANVVPFWVFCTTTRGHKLVLAAPAHDLSVKNKRWKGYREIELTWLTARQISTVLFRFDGERYVKYRANLELIR